MSPFRQKTVLSPYTYKGQPDLEIGFSLKMRDIIHAPESQSSFRTLPNFPYTHEHEQHVIFAKFDCEDFRARPR